MKKHVAALLPVIALLACHHDPGRKGAINLGVQPTAITLLTTNNDVQLSVAHAAIGTIIRLAPASGGSTITGFDSSTMEDGDLLMLRNDSDTDVVTLTNADTASLAHNRMVLPAAASVVIAPRHSMWLEFDKTAASWVAGPGLPNTPTFAGAATFSGGVTFTSGVGLETKTSGALDTTKNSNITVANTQAFTLADGTTPGQIKVVECTGTSGTPLGTLTIATPLSGESATHVFTAAGQRLTLLWLSGGWHVVDKIRAGRQAVALGSTDLAGYDMAAAYDLSVDGTKHSTGTKGIPAGSVAGEHIHLDVLTAANTATGDIDITTKSTVGVAGTHWGATGTSIGSAGTNTTATLDAYWDGAAWQVTVVATATLS